MMSTDARQTDLASLSPSRGMLRDAIGVLSGANIATACGIVQNLLVLLIVPPIFMGIWTTMRSILEYGTHASLGINRAAGLTIAVAGGRGDQAMQRRAANVAMTIEIVTALMVAAVLWIVGAALLASGNAPWIAACTAAGAVSIVSRYVAFSLTVLRSHGQFTTLARTRVFGAILELMLFTAGAYLFGFLGVLGAAVLAHLAIAWFVRRDGGHRFNLEIDTPLAKSLLASGWPMAAEALALTALRNIDRFVVLYFLTDGARQLGWYRIPIMMSAWAFDQSLMISNVLYPRLGETLGRTNEPAAVFRLGFRTAEVTALAMVVGAMALLAMGVPAVYWLLPQYRPGLVAVSGAVTAAALLGTSMPLRYALLTVGWTKSILITTGLAAAVSLGGAIAVVHALPSSGGGELASIGWSSAAAAAFCLLSVLGVCCATHSELLPAALRIVSISVYCVAGTLLLATLQGTPGSCAVTASVWCIAPLWHLSRQVDWRDLLGHPQAAPLNSSNSR